LYALYPAAQAGHIAGSGWMLRKKGRVGLKKKSRGKMWMFCVFFMINDFSAERN
jgi:hypothetical protein